jgi:subtilisin family serine protease
MKRITVVGWAAVAALWIALPLQSLLGGEPGDPNSSISGYSSGDGGAPGAAWVPDQLVARAALGANPAEILGGGVVAVSEVLSHSAAVLLQLSPGSDVDSAARALEASGAVDYAHPNYLLNRLHPVQGSYPFPDLNDVGEYALQQASLSLQLSAAHQQATGEGARVGVIDVGVDFDFDILQGVAVSGYDFVDDDAVALDEPGGLESGHGTFVAGLVHLAAPGATLRAYRVADAEGYGDGFTLARAIERAVDDGCDIINLSLVLLKRHLAVRDALLYAESHGTLVVAAAGNQAKTAAVYPAAEASAMAVGAVDDLLVRASFSSYGPHLSVCAPGVDLYSSYQGDHFAWWSGTSFAAPLVAGTAALLLELDPAADGTLLRNVLEYTATDVSAQNPTLSGLLGHGQIDPLAAISYIASTETATVTPDTLFFTHQVGRMYLIPPFAFAGIHSSNQPAAYVAEVVGPDSLFAWVGDTVGVTPDSVMVQISPPNVPGVYTNTVLFHVAGVADPARLTVRLDVMESDSSQHVAWTVPDVLYFQAQAGVEVLLSQQVLLASHPSPLPYTGTVLPGAGLTSISPSTGVTPDSVTIIVEPARAFSAGMYEDTVSFQVEGVPYPVPVFVRVYITDSLPQPSAPRFVVDTVATVSGADVNVSVRAAAADDAWGGFELLLDFPANTLNLQAVLPGQFLSGCEWEYFTYRTPAAGKVNIVAVADINDATHPSCLTPAPGDELARITFHVPDDSAPGCQVAPIRFWWEQCSDNALTDQGGGQITLVSPLPGSVRDFNGTDLTGTPGYGGPPEPCPDGISILRTSQFQNGAVFIHCDSLPQPTDTAWVQPASLMFTSVEGFVPAVMLSQWVHVSSTNAPALYVAGVSGPGPLFTALPDSIGQTHDSLEILVNPAGMPAGTYFNTVRFYVNGIASPAQLSVQLVVTPDSIGGGGGDTAAVVPASLVVTVLEGDSQPHERWVMLYSTNAPALYFAYSASGVGFLSVPDSVGYTHDSVRIVVNPAGYSVGSYLDSAIFDVQGTDWPVTLVVDLQVVRADSVKPQPYNYPNPFNPETQIAFVLPARATVSLAVFNILGERVTTLVQGELPAGEQRFVWNGRGRDGRPAASGVYFYRLEVGAQVYTGKMLMLR